MFTHVTFARMSLPLLFTGYTTATVIWTLAHTAECVSFAIKVRHSKNMNL